MHELRPVAIVTGASSGIGRALAGILAARGYRVGLIARRREVLDALADEIRSDGGTAVVAAADVGNRTELRSAVAQVVEGLGPVDIMVANAGFGVHTDLDPLNIDDVETTFRVNLHGVVYSIEAVLPSMLARRTGQIVAISSLAAFKGLPGESAYCASKAAVNAYTEGLRISLRGHGVVVATVCPGFIDTPMNTMNAASTPFLMTADAAARRITRVIERRRSGVICFPWPMAILTRVIARLPDGLVARLVGHGAPEHPPLKASTLE
jgi:short-subunit dehydrogenase